MPPELEGQPAGSPAPQQPPTAYRHAGGGEPAPQSAERWISKTFTRDEIRNDRRIARFASADDMGRAYVELERRVGGKVTVPSADASDSDREAFYRDIGRPGSPADYTVAEKFKDLDEVDRRFATKALEGMHRAGLTDSQASAVTEFYLAQERAARAAEDARAEHGINLLRHQWDGAGGNGFAREWNRAVDAVDALNKNVPGLKQLLKNPLFGSNPAIIKLMNFLGRTMSGDGKPAAATPTTPSAAAGDELRARKAELMKRDSPYWSSSHSEHARYVADVRKINEQLARPAGA